MKLGVEEITEIFREYAKFPNVSSGRISNIESVGHLTVYSEWTQRDLEQKEKVKFARNHVVHLDIAVSMPPNVISNEIWNVESPSGKYRAIVRNLKDKKGEEITYVEVWEESKKVQCVNITTLERHGKVYGQCDFGCLQWSHSETHLLYVAERKEPKAKSFFDKKAAADIDSGKTDIVQGDEFVYRESWGEQMVDKVHPVICVLDINGGMISTLDNVPEEVSPGQARWCPDDSGVVCVGWYHEPYRLGLIYCTNRRSALFHIDLKTFECKILGSNDKAVRSPTFSPDGEKLVYLEGEVGGAHHQCMRLVMIDWPTKGVVPVIERVNKVVANEFPGLFSWGLTDRCWLKDNKRIILSTNWKSKLEMVCINCEDGTVEPVTNSEPDIGGWTLLDVHNDTVLAACSSPNRPEFLVIGQVPEPGKESTMKWTKLEECPVLDDITWLVFDEEVPEEYVDKKYNDIKNYECFIMKPKLETKGQKYPLVVYPHGGPHTSFTTTFFLQFAAITRCGYIVLLINYRGSTGFGQDCVDCLVGNAGVYDVQDCQNAARKVAAMDDVDENKVVVCGGSHGGFLTAHLIGQFPDFYKAACLRNPVINIGTKCMPADSPDLAWCSVEGGVGNYDFKQICDPASYEKMYKRSPIQYVDQVKTPVLLMVGAKDLRVPPKQAHEYRRALQARGVPVRMMCYPEDCHPIVKVETESDAFVNIMLWFEKYINP